MNRIMENRHRCYKCNFYSRNICQILFDCDIGEIDNCILENQYIKSLISDIDSPEYFMFKNDPKIFLCYLNYKRRNNIPKVGTKVVTMRSGFGGYEGCIRTISEIDEKCIYLIDSKNNKYVSLIDKWYMDFWCL